MISTDIAWDEYTQVNRMNPSTLVAGIKSMRHLFIRMRDGFGEPSDPMRFGTGLHALLLEPDKFEARFCVMPDFHKDEMNTTGKGERSESKATKYYKEQVANFHHQNSDKQIVTREQYDRMLYAIESIRSKLQLVELLESSEKEVTIYGEIDGVACKGRVDLLSATVLADLKTTSDVSPRAFGRTFANLHYAFKLAMYRELVRQNVGDREVKVIAQETAGDFDTVLYSVDAIILDNALGRVRSVIADMKAARESGEWHGVDRGMPELVLLVPQWAMGDEESGIDWSGVETVEDEKEEAYF